MSEKRKSVMVLPITGNQILLQSFTNPDDSIIWDGFGRFYTNKEDPISTAEAVSLDYFKSISLPIKLDERARLNYFIEKPGGMVNLDVTVYTAETDIGLQMPDHAKWFTIGEIPYVQMHQATGKWLPLLLSRSEHIDAKIKVEQLTDHTAGVVTEFTVQ